MSSKVADLDKPVKKDELDAEDLAALAALDAEAKEFDKDAEIERILTAFRLDAYAVLDLQPGIPEGDIKRCYRSKSLLIHPDKTSNPRAPDAFDRLAKAQQDLMDEKARARLDEAIADARMLLLRERKLTIDDTEEMQTEDFKKAWREKSRMVLVENELRRQKQMKAEAREEGRQQRKEEEELNERKRKRDHQQAWEDTRDQRIGSWRDFQKGKDGKKKKDKKMKVLG